MGRNGLLREVVRSRLEHERKCRELEEAEARRNRSLENRWNPEAPQTVDVKLRHGFALLEERRARTTHSRNSYKLCQDEIECTRDLVQLEVLTSELGKCKSQMLKAQSDVNNLTGLFDLKLDFLDWQLDQKLVEHCQCTEMSRKKELNSKIDIINDELNSLQDSKKRAYQSLDREDYFKGVANGDEFEAFCQINPERVRMVHQQLDATAIRKRALKPSRANVLPLRKTHLKIDQSLLTDGLYQIDSQKFSKKDIDQIAARGSTSPEIVNHLLVQNCQNSRDTMAATYHQLSDMSIFFARQTLKSVETKPLTTGEILRAHSFEPVEPTYLVPSSFVFHGNVNYTHLTKSGQKVDMNFCEVGPEKGGIFLYAYGKTPTQARLEFLREEKLVFAMMNGIQCDRMTFFENLTYASRLAENCPVIGIFSPTTGSFGGDIIGCKKGLSGIWTEATLDLDSALRGILQDKANAEVRLMSHSGAAIHSRLVLDNMGADLLSRIDYLGVSPAVHVDNKHLKTCVSIISSKDGCVDGFFLKDSRNEALPCLVEGNRDHNFNSASLHARKKEFCKALT